MHDHHRHVELEVLRAWETVKINATCESGEASPGQLQLGSLQLEVLEPLGLKLSNLIESYSVIHDDGSGQPCPQARGETRMVLPVALIASLFEPSINAIIQCLDEYLATTRAGEATHLLLAGGYSACPFLREALLEHISRGERSAAGAAPMVMYTLQNPDLAIMKGAAIYGTAHRERVESRIAKCTYGEQVMVRYNPHDPEHKKREGTVVADHRGLRYLPAFLTHVSAGQELPVGFTSPRQQSTPLHDTADTLNKVFLASTVEPLPRFPDEVGVREVACFKCPVATTLPFDERGVETAYEFGGTEIKLHIYRLHDNHKMGTAMATYF
jgi:hypothetical protein